jgi:5-formyltetrahydrofolate cyclo-ligase
MQQRQQLRQTLRARRRSLSKTQQQQAAWQLAHHLRQQTWFIQAKTLVVYLANDGELDPEPLARMATALNKKVYLPVLHPFQPRLLWFIRWVPGQTPLVKNRFGIREPRLKGYGLDRCRQIHPWAVDRVFLPLVGFDRQGGRLGMGGGFYDRTFDVSKSHPRRPLLIGLAHNCQEVPHLPQAAWDVPLNGIATPEGYLPCSHVNQKASD